MQYLTPLIPALRIKLTGGSLSVQGQPGLHKQVPGQAGLQSETLSFMKERKNGQKQTRKK